MKEIKKLAAALNTNMAKVSLIESKISETMQQARFPLPEKVLENKVPKFDGQVRIHGENAHSAGTMTYRLEKQIIPAERDQLEFLREQRQTEIGQAHIDGRAPAVTTFNEAIACIEGARAALPILERQLAAAKDSEEEARRELYITLAPVMNDYFSQAEKAYELVTEELRTQLGHMFAVSKIASRLGADHGAGLTARFNSYVEALRSRGLVVGRPHGVSSPDWISNILNLPSTETKEAELNGKLVELGVTL